MQSKCKIDIIFDSINWKNEKSITKIFINNLCNDFINFLELKSDIKFSFCILLTSDIKMKELNNSFRKINKTTDILSFPEYNNALKEFKNSKNMKLLEIGDIAIGYDKINNDALLYKRSFKNHFIHLLIHSILHLLGFTHDHEEDREIMESIEKNYIKKNYLYDPYFY